MNIANLFKFILILLSFASCSQTDKNKEFINSESPSKVNYENKYTLELEEQIKAPLYDDISSRSYYYKLYKDSLFYFAYKNKLAILNLNTQKIRKIAIPEYLLKNDIYGIEVINQDSLFISEIYPPSISLITLTNDTVVLKKHFLKKINLETDNESYNNDVALTEEAEANFNLDDNGLAYNKVTKQLHIGFEAYDYVNFAGFENTHQIGVYDWKNNEWVDSYAPPQGLRKNKGKNSYGSSPLSRKKFLLKGDSTIVYSELNHGITLYKEGNFIGNIPFVSALSEKIKSPLSFNESNEIERVLELMHTSPKYSKTFYHEKVKLYSRIYLAQQNTINALGQKNVTDDRQAYIVFQDENFNYVGEYKLDDKTFESRIVGTSDGFLMFANKYDETDLTDSYFPLRYKYKIVTNTSSND